MSRQYLTPLEQLYRLNQELIGNMSNLSEPICVVGGQSVAYWLNYYSDMLDITDADLSKANSVDIDYVSVRKDVAALARVWKSQFYLADDHPAPSIALIKLQDEKSRVKTDANGLKFLDVDAFEFDGTVRSNIIDILDWPAGFEKDDFHGKKINQFYTTAFEFPESLQTNSHEWLRILTPLGCLKSRMANLFLTPKPKNLELARIELLLQPTAFYFQDLAADKSFRETKVHINKLFSLVRSEQAVKLYVDYSIDLRKLYQHVCSQLANAPELFLKIELPSQLTKLNSKYERRLIARKKNTNDLG